MRDLPSVPLFTAAEATASGWSRSALARAVRSGRLVRVRRGIFSCSPVDDVGLARAAAAVCGGSVISHRSAALIHGIPVLRPPARPELTVPPDGTGDVARALLHRATMLDDDIIELHGAQVTSPARTIADIARSRPTPEAMVSVDAALHERIVCAEDVAVVLRRCRSWPGYRQAVRTIAHADSRSESPLESISRVRMSALALPAPSSQRLILDERDTAVARVDFWWDEHGVAGEADGRLKYENDALWAEKQRQERLEELGIVVVRWGWHEVTAGRGRVLASRLYGAFERADRLRAAGFPRLWSVAAP